MQQFIVGLIVGLASALFVVFVFCKRASFAGRQTNDNRNKKDNQSEQVEQLSRLTGALAHEIKNPLSIIKINLKLVGEDLKELDVAGRSAVDKKQLSLYFSKAFRKIAVIEKETDRLEHILDGFLRYVDGAELKAGPMDINELVSDMIDFYSPQAHRYSMTIRQGLSSEPLVCRVNSDMLKQVLLNLFINAGQAVTAQGELIIRTFRQNDNAVIQVGDTGRGISPDRLGHIFEAYYSSGPKGSGLGLPTAKKIINAHNGSIDVTSQPGKGTLFTIKLPILTGQA